MLSAAMLDLLAKACAISGFGCFLWPYLQKWRGLDTVEAQSDRARLRSRTWWIGFVLICLALMFQRLAAQPAGG